MTTLSFNVHRQLPNTAKVISAATGENIQRVRACLRNLYENGYVERASKSHGPGYPTRWRAIKPFVDGRPQHPNSRANLRRGPAASSKKTKGKAHPEELRKKNSISHKRAWVRKRMKRDLEILMQSKVALDVCWRGNGVFK